VCVGGCDLRVWGYECVRGGGAEDGRNVVVFGVRVRGREVVGDWWARQMALCLALSSTICQVR